MPDMILLEVEDQMQKSISATARDFSRVQTGRASASLLDGIVIDYYGAKSPLNQVATITTPEPRLIVIQPWDKSVIKDIERSIARSDLGLNPNSDGNLIRIQVPELTTERRQELTRYVSKLAEDGRISVRNVRRDGNDRLKKMEKAKEISEDDLRIYRKDVQKLTDDHIKKIDKLLDEKEAELLEI